MKGAMMIGAGIAVGVFGLLSAVFHSFVFLSLALFSFIFFFVALFSKESLPVLIGFTLGAAIALAAGSALIGENDASGSVQEAEGEAVASEVPEAPSEAVIPEPEEIAVPEPPEIFSLIKLEGVRYYKPSAPELFFVITDIDW